MKKITFLILLIGTLVFSITLAKAATPEASDATSAEAVATPALTDDSQATAEATTDNEAVVTTTTDTYQKVKNNYQEAVTNYQSARQDWLSAKSQYRNSRSTTDLENALTKAKAHMIKVTEVMINYLTAVKNRLQNMKNIDETLLQNLVAEIDSDISWLEGKQTEINNASNKDDLITVASTIRDRWDEIKVRARKYVGSILVGKINIVIAKLEKARDVAHDKINLLKENGQDTTKLENLEADFNQKIDHAKDQLEKARNKFNQISSLEEVRTLFNEGKEFLELANKYVREAWQILQSIITDLKKSRLYFKEVSGTGTIYLEGQGTTTLSGNGTVSGTTDTGATAVITDNEGDAIVDTYGQGKKEELGNNQTRYTGFGKLTVTGTNMEVKISGSTLKIDASGTGTVAMKGTGTYRIGDGVTTDIPAGGIKITLTSV